MTDAGVHTGYYFIKWLRGRQTEPLYFDFSCHLESLYAQPRLPELHNSIAPAVLRPFSTALFSAANNAVLAEGAPVVRNGWNDRRFTAVADVEIRSSDRWQGEPRWRCNAPHYDERRHDSDPDSCRPSRLAS